MAQHSQLRLITELNITPLITVVLVLLFVFMLAGPLLHDGAVPVPEKTSTPPSSIARLVLDKSGTIALDGRPVLLANLKDQLASLVKDKPGTGVLVQMDRELPVQVLVDLMDVLRLAGVQKTAVATLEK